MCVCVCVCRCVCCHLISTSLSLLPAVANPARSGIDWSYGQRQRQPRRRRMWSWWWSWSHRSETTHLLVLFVPACTTICHCRSAIIHSRKFVVSIHTCIYLYHLASLFFEKTNRPPSSLPSSSASSPSFGAENRHRRRFRLRRQATTLDPQRIDGNDLVDDFNIDIIVHHTQTGRYKPIIVSNSFFSIIVQNTPSNDRSHKHNRPGL